MTTALAKLTPSQRDSLLALMRKEAMTLRKEPAAIAKATSGNVSPENDDFEENAWHMWAVHTAEDALERLGLKATSALLSELGAAFHTALTKRPMKKRAADRKDNDSDDFNLEDAYFFGLVTTSTNEAARTTVVFPNDSSNPILQKLLGGERIGKDLPKDLTCCVSETLPAGKLATILSNDSGYLILHDQAKAILEKHATADLEFLPLTILDKTGKKTLSREYWLINPLAKEALIHSSETKKYRQESKAIDRKLQPNYGQVLDGKKAAAAADVCRLAQATGTYLVRKSVLKHFAGNGFTNFVIVQMPIG